MLQKISPIQLKIGLALAFLLYIVNWQNHSNAAKARRSLSQNNLPTIALAASTPQPVNSCTSGQNWVDVDADAVLNLRSYPNGPVIGTLPPGATVTTQQREGDWLEVTTASGQQGWAFGQYLGCR